MTQLSSFQPLPLPPGPATAASTQLTPFSSCWEHPTTFPLDSIPSSYRVPSFPCPLNQPLHSTPLSAYYRSFPSFSLLWHRHCHHNPNSLEVHWQLVCPLSRSVRGPIPTRRRAVAVAAATAAASETSVQSPLWKKNTSLAPALFLLFLSFSVRLSIFVFSPCTPYHLPPLPTFHVHLSAVSQPVRFSSFNGSFLLAPFLLDLLSFGVLLLPFRFCISAARPNNATWSRCRGKAG